MADYQVTRGKSTVGDRASPYEWQFVTQLDGSVDDRWQAAWKKAQADGEADASVELELYTRGAGSPTVKFQCKRDEIAGSLGQIDRLIAAANERANERAQAQREQAVKAHEEKIRIEDERDEIQAELDSL